VDPVVLFKLALLGYLYSIRSERQLCEEAGLNLAWRWFLGYELSEPIPDHSVLTKARQRFGPAGYGQFFQRVVGLGGERGLIPGRRLYVDSTLVAANASAKSVQSRTLPPATAGAAGGLPPDWSGSRRLDGPVRNGSGRSRPWVLSLSAARTRMPP
jgi:hypothetical protein